MNFSKPHIFTSQRLLFYGNFLLKILGENFVNTKKLEFSWKSDEEKNICVFQTYEFLRLLCLMWHRANIF